MDSWNSKPENIQHAISKHRWREKPRFPVIVRPRREREPVERGAPLLEPQHLLSDALAEIRRERYALAAIAHAIVNAVVLPQMRQCIESVPDPSHPCMRHAHGFQLRKYPRHHLPQSRHAGERVLLGQSRPAAEYDALAVGRRPEIHDDSPRIDDVAPARN